MNRCSNRCQDKYHPKTLRSKFLKNVFLAYININSIRNKLNNLFEITKNYFDVLSVSETKLDASFPDSQFKLTGYKKPYRLDSTSRSGGILVYVKNDIPSKLLFDFIIPQDIQIIPFELNLRNQKQLIISIYRPPSLNLNRFLNCLSDILDCYCRYDRVIIMGDFNCDPKAPAMVTFLTEHELFNHMHQNTCWKSSNGTCIDLILSNQKFSLQKTGTFETGLSDHHSLVYTILKTTYQKLPPKTLSYRSYKYFNHEQFCKELWNSFSNTVISCYDNFDDIFMAVLDRLAPLKFKVVRGNQSPHLNRNLSKAIMIRSRLKSIANKTRTMRDWQAYKRQRNYVVNLNKMARRNYFNHLETAPSSGSKKFWTFCKPLFSNKSNSSDRIILTENNNIVSDDLTIASVFNSYFNSITQELNLQTWNCGSSILFKNPVQAAIYRYQSHPSVLNIKSKTLYQDLFFFKAVTETEVQKLIAKLDSRKKTSGGVPTRLFQTSAPICVNTITRCINNALHSCEFPSKLKLAEIIPIHKKAETNMKCNYRPISLLPVVSKIFEKILYSQINTFFQDKFSPLLCGFRQGHSTQHALFNLLKNWQRSMDEGKIVGTVLMDLSKAYDCIPYGLLIAKLKAYGFGSNSLTLLYSYLSGRKHRVRIGNTVSSWLELPCGVPQGSILGPLLFNVFINDIFDCITVTSVCNFADDNSLYASGRSLVTVKEKLTCDTSAILRWFSLNSMVANPDKFQIMFLGVHDNAEISLEIGDINIPAKNTVKLLGVDIDHKLKFSTHVTNICNRISNRTKALLRIRRYITLKKALLLYNAYIVSSFFYCPLIWMFCSKSSHNLINKTHRRALCALHYRFDIDLEELLQLNGGVTVHTKHLRILLTEVYKCLTKLNPEFMWNCFEAKDTIYNLRSQSTVRLPPTNTRSFGLNSILFRGSLLWNTLPNKLKSSTTLHEFKRRIKCWDGSNCTCLICRNF